MVEKPTAVSFFTYALIIGCLVILSSLYGGLEFTITAVSLNFLGVWFLVLALRRINPQVCLQYGNAAITSTVARGFVLLLPFAILALVSKFWLHWQVPLAFVSAGLMAAGAATGGEVAKLGGGRLFPLLWSTLLSLGFMLLSIQLAAE